MDVDSLKILLSLTTLGLVLAFASREYLAARRNLKRIKVDNRLR